LLSPGYNDSRRKLVGERASLELRPGRPEGRTPRVLVGGHETVITGAGIGEPTLGEPATSPLGVVAGDTCHVDVVDRWGNMVSATPSGGWLQSSPVIPELGVCLGSRMQMFWLEEGLPASLEPGKRPRSTLSPSVAFKDGEPYLAFGTPGGDQQDQWSVLMFLHHVHHGMNLQEAIDARPFTTSIRRARSIRVPRSRALWHSKRAFRKRRAQLYPSGAIACGSATLGRKVASPVAPASPPLKAPCSKPPPTHVACRATPLGADARLRPWSTGRNWQKPGRNRFADLSTLSKSLRIHQSNQKFPRWSIREFNRPNREGDGAYQGTSREASLPLRSAREGSPCLLYHCSDVLRCARRARC
jgi:hypothetical protein